VEVLEEASVEGQPSRRDSWILHQEQVLDGMFYIVHLGW
jgi:hypothetical protein